MQEYRHSEQTPVLHGCMRLLKLHPGSGQSDLEGNLLVRWAEPSRFHDPGEGIEDPEPYDALSYHWGHTDKETKFIKILAQSQSYIIKIKPNLDAALRQLRNETAPEFFWVDALCINQSDEDEKTRQILQMSIIYKNARSVAVWLGPERDNSGQAIEFIHRCLNLDDFDSLVQDSFASKDWAALSALMRRSWFNRRWIIQEIALAKEATLHCGKDEVSWRDFADVISLFSSKQHELRQLFRESAAHRNHPDYLGDLSELGAVRLVFASDNLFRKSEQGDIMEHLFSLEAVMSSMSAFEAADPHDILYAVLWLAHDSNPTEGLKPLNRHVSATNTPTISPIAAGEFPEETSNAFTLSESPQANPRVRISTSPILEDSDPRSNSPGRSTPPPVHSSLTNGNHTSQASNEDSDHRPPQRRVTFDDRPKSKQEHLFPATSIERRLSMRKLSIAAGTAALADIEKAKAAVAKARQGLSKGIVVDYRKDVFQVCKDFLAFTISKSQSLDMICRPWAPDHQNLPSWVPPMARGAFSPGVKRVHRRVNADPLVGEPGIGNKSYRAASSRKAEWKPHPNNDRALIVKGFVLDWIKEKKSSAAAGIVPAEWMLAAGWTDASSLPPDSFWRTLVGNRNAHGQRPPSHWRRVCRDAFSRKPERGDLNTSEIIMYDCPSAVREFLERVQCMVWGRRLVVLERMSQCLALVPTDCKKGDMICILDGCSVPVVLRKFINGENAAKKLPKCQHPDCPSHKSLARTYSAQHTALPNGVKEDVDEYYEFVGEAYVHGMMDGEAFGVRREKFREYELR